MSRGSPQRLLFFGHLNKFTVTVTVTRRDRERENNFRSSSAHHKQYTITDGTVFDHSGLDDIVVVENILTESAGNQKSTHYCYCCENTHITAVKTHTLLL
jgi:hypothetical protein